MAETRLIFHLQCVIQKAQIQPSDAKHWVLLTGDAKNAPVCVLAGMLHLCFTKKNGLVSQMHKAEATTIGDAVIQQHLPGRVETAEYHQ